MEKEKALELTKDFVEYSKIHSMDDAPRCYKFLNGDPLALAEFSDSDYTTCNSNSPSLDSLLNKYHIDKSVYLNFRSRLEKTKLRNYCRAGNMNAYIVDGWIDDV